MKKKLGLLMVGLLSMLFFASPVAATAGGHGGGSTGGGGGGSVGGGTSTGTGSDSYNSFHSSGGYRYGAGEDRWVAAIAVGSIGFVTFGGLHRRRREEKERYEDFMASIPGTKKEKKATLKQVESVFLQIQKDWDAQNLSHRECYTEKLYREHQRVLTENQEQGIVNHTRKVSVQSLTNYRAVSDNSFSILITFTALDYEQDVQSGRVFSGSKYRKQYFEQTWYFDRDRGSNTWRADFIQPINLS